MLCSEIVELLFWCVVLLGKVCKFDVGYFLDLGSFCVWMDFPYFVVAVIGLIMFVLGIVLFVLFTPLVIDVVSLMVLLVGIVLSATSVLSNVTKNYFGTAIVGLGRRFESLEKRFDSLEREVRGGFTSLGMLLKEIRDELRRR
ncbi:MAG: hypothetical protein DRJ40_02920 [Thermoprotei archaeon]|nr:MAG: hypothetical protein DRJ40_02920 [Thermoprotei archaeon]